MNEITTIDRIKQILRETSYNISVVGSGNKCTLSLPSRQMAPKKQARKIKYELLRGGGVNITGDVDSYWICPDYTTRGSIYMDIIKKCKEYEYEPLAILYSNDDYEEADNLLQIVDPPEGVDLEKELVVTELAQIAFQHNTIGVLVELREEATRLGIQEGFEFLISNFCGRVKV